MTIWTQEGLASKAQGGRKKVQDNRASGGINTKIALWKKTPKVRPLLSETPARDKEKGSLITGQSYEGCETTRSTG